MELLLIFLFGLLFIGTAIGIIFMLQLFSEMLLKYTILFNIFMLIIFLCIIFISGYGIYNMFNF